MLFIDYITTNQTCEIITDSVDQTWKEIRLQFNLSDEQSVISEKAIYLPWHAFISNLYQLKFIRDYYKVQINFSVSAETRIRESVAELQRLNQLENIPPKNEAEILELLKQRGFDFSKRTLTAEQKRNIGILSRVTKGATFSVPGAGKTTEAICFYLLLAEVKQRLFVICPKNAYSVWEEQFEECLGDNSPRIERLILGSRNIENILIRNSSQVYLISYQQFNRSIDVIAEFLYKNKCFVFIDESHRIKGGSKTDTGRQIQKIAHLPEGKLLMSGTPMPNSIADLIPQYAFLFPTESGLDEENIVAKIRRVYVRTTKNELGIRPASVFKTSIPLSDPQRELYQLVCSEEFRQIRGLVKDDKKLFRQLGKSYMRLLQIVSNPALLLKAGYGNSNAVQAAIMDGESNKIKYAVSKARQLARVGKKTIIWSGFVNNVELVTSLLADIGARYIHGGVEAGDENEEDKREGIIKNFHENSQAFVLVANPAACAEGISLHKVCHHAMYIDRNYNAALFLQSMDRIHRLGLPPDIETSLEIIHTPGSIDDLIDSRLKLKIDRMSDVLNDASLRYDPIFKEIELDEYDGFDEDSARELYDHIRSFAEVSKQS